MLAEIRIESLGAISTATAEFDRGFTVLTGETGTGKTMVVTGLHLLGGARADATRVRSGAERAVVEGRFTTTELGDGVAAHVDGILDSSGADRDDDGSVIAARSVSRDGPSRAYLGGRSVPAKSLSTFTTELLALHGQNDQLRLMRPEEQRAALDRFVDIESQLKRYRRVRDDWLEAFSGHPRIGERHAERSAGVTAEKWAEQEQAGMSGADAHLKAEFQDLDLEDVADGSAADVDRSGEDVIAGPLLHLLMNLDDVRKNIESAVLRRHPLRIAGDALDCHPLT